MSRTRTRVLYICETRVVQELTARVPLRAGLQFSSVYDEIADQADITNLTGILQLTLNLLQGSRRPA